MPAGVRAGTAYVDVRADTSALDRQLGRRNSDLARKFGRAGIYAGAALAGGLVVGAKKSIEAASDLEESINKASATFEKSSPKIKRWAKQTADSLGISRQAALENASSIGAMLKPMGVAPQRAAEMSRRMVRLAADMASFNNEDPTEMLDRIRAGLSGESEPLKRYGTVLSETRVQQHAWKVGIAEAGEELTEQQKIMGRYSLLLKDTKDQHGDFARTSESLANVQRRLKANITDTSASIGNALLPTVKDAAKELNDLAAGISDIFERKDLDFGEKLARSLDLTKRELEPYGEEIAHLIERGVTEGIPAAAEAAAERAPKVAAAFVTGFARSDEWGRLALGGLLLAKFGGFGAFRKIGVGAGAAVAAGMTSAVGGGAAAGAAGGAARGGLVGGLLAAAKSPLGKAGLVGVGLTAANVILDEIDHQTRVRGDDLFEALEEKAESGGLFKDFTDQLKHGPIPLGKEDFGSDEAGDLAAELKNIVNLSQHISADRARELRDAMGEAGDVSREARKEFDRIIEEGVKRSQRLRIIQGNFDSMRNGYVDNVREMRRVTKQNFQDIEHDIGLHTKQGKDAVRDNFNEAVRWIAREMRDGKGVTQRGGREIERLLDSHSREGRKALARNFNDVVTVIRATMRRGGKITDEGLKVIRQLYVEQLKLYGFSPKQAIQEARPGVTFAGGPEEGTRVPDSAVVRPQRGQYIAEGKPSGDSVPAMLERGEYVLNREAVKKIGKRRLDQINFADAPRFQGGGIVELLHPGNDPNHQDHLHIAMLDRQALVALGRRLQALGWLVSENPAFGGVDPVHTSGSYHYSGQAIDVNWPDASAEKAKIAALLPMLRGGNIASVELLKRMVVGGPDSPLKTTIQAGLDQAVASASARLKGLSPIEGAEITGLGGSGAELMKQIAAQRGWNFADWWEIDRRETTHGADIVNEGSGAINRAQFLGSNIGAYGPGSLPGASMDEQIISMARYIADRYGNPTSALAFHNAHGWYSRGGMVGMQLGGAAGYDFGTYPKFGGILGRAIDKVRGLRPRKRRKAIHKLIDQIRDIGLPEGLRKDLSTLDEQERTFGEFADRASRITDTEAINNALEAELNRRKEAGQGFPDADQQALVDSMLGRVYGGTEVDWLTKQLDALFKLRNRLIEAEQVAVRRREKVLELLEKGQHRLGVVKKRLKRDIDERDGLRVYRERTRRNLQDELAKPKNKQNQGFIDAAREALKISGARMEALRNRIEPDTRERNALTNKILPALRDRQGNLSTLRGDLLSNLEEVQGLGSPSEKLAQLPALGVLGGLIGDAQFALADLARDKIRVTDSESSTDTESGTSEADRERVALLEEMLRLEQQRFAVSQAQYGVFQGLPFGGTFHQGGTIPGPPGQDVMIRAQAGETVVPRGGGPEVRVIVADGMGWLKDFIRVEVRNHEDAQVRRGVRALPGKAGYLA